MWGALGEVLLSPRLNFVSDDVSEDGAPLLADVDKKIPFAEAKQTVYDALAPLGEDYRKILKEGFENFLSSESRISTPSPVLAERGITVSKSNSFV